MKFIDKEHKNFYNEMYKKMQNLGKTDVYYKSLVYALGISEPTRQHFSEIFDIENSNLNLDSINSAWQTSTSAKTTRLAISLWNSGCMYDSEDDMKNDKVSDSYNVSEIFCCSYAPFFYEAIKLRYPEYTREYKNEIEKYIDEMEE